MWVASQVSSWGPWTWAWSWQAELAGSDATRVLWLSDQIQTTDFREEGPLWPCAGHQPPTSPRLCSTQTYEAMS